jgi:L-iditol 2-dehydrogenase
VCTPKPEAIESAADTVAPGGTVCLYAPPSPQAPPHFDATALYLREISVVASYSAGPGDMRAALELIATKRIDPRPLVSHRLPLAQTGEALDLQRRAGGLKIVVEP